MSCFVPGKCSADALARIVGKEMKVRDPYYMSQRAITKTLLHNFGSFANTYCVVLRPYLIIGCALANHDVSTVLFSGTFCCLDLGLDFNFMAYGCHRLTISRKGLSLKHHPGSSWFWVRVGPHVAQISQKWARSGPDPTQDQLLSGQ